MQTGVMHEPKGSGAQHSIRDNGAGCLFLYSSVVASRLAFRQRPGPGSWDWAPFENL